MYGDDADEHIPEGLLDVYFEAEGHAKAESSVAGQNTLSLAKGYVRDAGAWDIDARTPTRHTDDLHVALRLARVWGGRVVPYALDAAPDEAWREWRLSEVSVSTRRVGGEAIPPNLAKAAREAKAGSHWLKRHPPSKGQEGRSAPRTQRSAAARSFPPPPIMPRPSHGLRAPYTGLWTGASDEKQIKFAHSEFSCCNC